MVGFLRPGPVVFPADPQRCHSARASPPPRPLLDLAARMPIDLPLPVSRSGLGIENSALCRSFPHSFCFFSVSAKLSHAFVLNKTPSLSMPKRGSMDIFLPGRQLNKLLPSYGQRFVPVARLPSFFGPCCLVAATCMCDLLQMLLRGASYWSTPCREGQKICLQNSCYRR